MAWKVIKAKDQHGGALMGGFWVVLQAWPIANLYSLALLGPEGAKITGGGYGGWDVVEVPRSVGITEWKSKPNYELTLDLLFDGWFIHANRPNLPPSFVGRPKLPQGVSFSPARGLSMETAIRNLEFLATPHPPDMTAPPSLRVYGAVPHAEKRWVINGLDWGDAIRDKITGRRMRQQATVKLLEYNQPSDLKRLPKSQAKASFAVKKDKDKKRPWTVQGANGKLMARFSTRKSATAYAKKLNAGVRVIGG